VLLPVLLVIFVFHGILSNSCETYLGNEDVAVRITVPSMVYLGLKWMTHIERRNLQNFPESEEVDAVSTDDEEDVTEK
jgi:hypothetical protein